MSNNTAYRLTFGSAVFVSGLGKILHKKKPPEQGGQREDRSEGEQIGTCRITLPIKQRVRL
ncbi:hypothetical protein AU074_05145 [Pseudomonas sp. ATCC PTA-122608]|nr:hypothetical protein AU074_05145 [Pseudomonas sp. ATCC PTA-122608]